LRELSQIATDILDTLHSGGVHATLFGGLAIQELGLWDSAFGRFRSTRDVDVIVNMTDVRRGNGMMTTLGAMPQASTWLTTDGRLVRYDYRGIEIDLFSNPLRLNQTIHVPGDGFAGRCATLTTLFLSKIQLTRPNEADVLDGLSIMSAIGEDPLGYASEIGYLCGSDWCLFRATMFGLRRNILANLEFLREERRNAAARAATAIRRSLRSAPKSIGWRLRSRIGTLLPVSAETST